MSLILPGGGVLLPVDDRRYAVLADVVAERLAAGSMSMRQIMDSADERENDIRESVWLLLNSGRAVLRADRKVELARVSR